VELAVPDGAIIGAEAAHQVLAGWRRELQGQAAPPEAPAAGQDEPAAAAEAGPAGS